MSTILTISTEPTGDSDPSGQPKVGADIQETTTTDGQTNVKISVKADITDPESANSGDEGNNEGGEELILGKFKTQADLEAAYKELESKLGQTPKPNTQPQNTTIETAKAELTAKGLDFNKYSQEFLKTQKLSAESYQELLSKGIPPQMVDQFITGLQAQSEKNTNEIFSSVGGQETFGKLLNFAKTNLSVAEVQAYNDAVLGGNIEQVKLILSGVQQKYNAAMGQAPKNTHKGGSAPKGPQGDTYAHQDEYFADVMKPEYNRDSSFRRKVDQKLERSTAIWMKG